MPFQVVYSINQKKLDILILGGEGLEDITFLPLSLTQFTLTVEVLEGNPAGHTVEWELIQDDNPATVPEVSPLTIDSFGSSIVLDSAHGNLTRDLFPERQVWIYNSSDSSNDGPYIITSSIFEDTGSPPGSPSGTTILEVTPDIPNPNAVTPGMLRTQLGDDVYVTQPNFDITGASPPPLPWLMPGASLTDFTLYFLYAPTGIAYFKKWRIWIDRDTPLEDFEDVDIFPFPQDTDTYASKASSTSHDYVTLGATLTCRTLDESKLRIGGDLAGQESVAECPSPVVQLEWDLPDCDGDKIYGWNIEKLVNGIWKKEALGLPIIPRVFGPFAPGDIRRVVALFDQFENSGYGWAQPSEPLFDDPNNITATANDIKYLPLDTASRSEHVEVTGYNITLIEAATLDVLPTESFTVGMTHASSEDHLKVTTYNVTLIEADDITIPSDSFTVGMAHASTEGHLEVLTYNITLITGGGGG